MENDPLANPSNGLSVISASSQVVSDPPLVMLTIPISTKLDRDNYLSWQSQIVPVLHAYGLYQFLQSTTAPSATITTDTCSIQTNADALAVVWEKRSLEERVQRLLKTYEMEIFHKARIQDYKTVDPDGFTLSLNGRAPLNMKQVGKIGGGYNFLQPSLPDELKIYDPKKETEDSSMKAFKTVSTWFCN